MTEDQMIEMINVICSKLKNLLGDELKNYSDDLMSYSRGTLNAIVISIITSFLGTVLLYIEAGNEIYPHAFNMQKTLDSIHKELSTRLLKSH
jgi:hypothetical protein